MSKRTIFILILTVLWFWFCHYWYTCWIKQVCYGCGDNIENTTSGVVPQKTYGPLTFNANSDAAITNDKFPAAKDSILAGKTEDNNLEIVGYYHAGETAPTGFENMGLARAAKAKELFSGDIPDSRIRLVGKQVSGDAPAERFASADFNWLTVEVDKVEVVKTADGANILFPYNQARKEADPKIDAYLKQVAERVKVSGEKIKLVGHTDSKGSHRANVRLGKNRALDIRSILRRYGVNRNQITVESLGETSPVATNDTDEGRHQNRRVELSIIK